MGNVRKEIVLDARFCTTSAISFSLRLTSSNECVNGMMMIDGL